jgi:hypothetical protein
MHWIRRTAFALATAATLAACGDDDGDGGTGPVVDDLVGSWTLVAVNAEPVPNDQVTSGSAIFEADGGYDLEAELALGAIAETGTWTATTTQLTLTPDDETIDPYTVVYAIDGDLLHAEFFGNDFTFER